ncbi:unnamed protein product [Pedinophyceae sp. YPF-701]|nr:unnamed protein product [Pedinophyceae sp. YPF-701]
MGGEGRAFRGKGAGVGIGIGCGFGVGWGFGGAPIGLLGMGMGGGCGIGAGLGWGIGLAFGAEYINTNAAFNAATSEDARRGPFKALRDQITNVVAPRARVVQQYGSDGPKSE